MISRDAIQSDAIDAIVAERVRGRRSTLLHMPTQVGKTRTLCKYIGRGIGEWNARVLVCAHMGELLDQWANELAAMGIKYCVEKSKSKALDWMRIDPTIRVCLGSKDTLQNRGKTERLASWPRDFFTDVAEDECHLATEKTWKNVHEHFDRAFRVGLTATIDRMDGVPLSTIYESVAYCYPITAAIANGHRVPFRVIPVDCEIDIRGVRKNAMGDLNPGELEDRVGPRMRDLVNIVRERFEELRCDRGVEKGIVFLPTVALAKMFAGMMSEVGVKSLSVHGDDPDREVKIRSHKNGDFPLLVNQKLLGMGYNDPAVGVVVDLSPTKSRAWLDQKAGRCGATRAGKEFGFLMYAGWKCDTDDLIGPTDIFAVNESAKVQERARSLSRKSKESDPQKLIEQARELIAEEERQAERKAKYRIERRNIEHRWCEFDPIGVRSAARGQATEAVSRTSQDPQLANQLRSLGLVDTSGLSNQSMKEMIRFWTDRRSAGMATLKQFLYLVHRRRFHPARVMEMTSREVSQLMGQLHSHAS